CGYDFSTLQRFCGRGVVRKAQYGQQMNRGVAHRAWPALKHSEKKIAISLESCFGISTPCANALSHAVERGPAPPIRITVRAVRHSCQEASHLFRVRFHADHRAYLMKEIATPLRFVIREARHRQLKIRQCATRRCSQGSQLHPRVLYAISQNLVLG